MNLHERYRGCLLGLAVGDAVGTTLEFKPPGTFTPLDDMTGGGPFHLKAGQWTDDTSLALCLATSLVEKQGFDPADQMARYVRWYRDGYLSSTGSCFDIGNTTRDVLHRFMTTGEPFAGSTDPYMAGNGSVMRLAPVPMMYRAAPEKTIHFAGESSRTTHGAETAVSACHYFAALVIGALNGEHKETVLAPHYTPIPNYWQQHPLTPQIAEVADGSFKRRQPPDIVGSGYVVKSIEAALWAFHHTDNFREGCLLAANLGDDADTTAAIYGQIAGAFYGETDIPPEWRQKLALRSTIESLADQLFELAEF